MDDIKHVLAAMPSQTHIEKRNRAVVAFAILSGARDGALASLRLKHVDLVAPRAHPETPFREHQTAEDLHFVLFSGRPRVVTTLGAGDTGIFDRRTGDGEVEPGARPDIAVHDVSDMDADAVIQSTTRRTADKRDELAPPHWADEIIEIADDSTNDYIEKENKDGRTCQAVYSENINRSRLRVDTRKWLMARLAPKKYGDRVTTELVGDADNPLKHEVTVTFITAKNGKPATNG